MQATMSSPDRDILITRILSTIECHTPSNPITSGDLSAMYGIDVRQINDIVKKLIWGRRKIRSWRGGWDEWLGRDMPAGYSLARNPEEMRASAEMLRSTAMSILDRARELMDFGSLEPQLWEQGFDEIPGRDAA
jgi:hypothetical protein